MQQTSSKDFLKLIFLGKFDPVKFFKVTQINHVRVDLSLYTYKLWPAYIFAKTAPLQLSATAHCDA